jgi:DNA-binding winged helix-turn-helix (wHTH) protein
VSAVAFRFARCTLDVDARQLFRAGREVHLSPKAFELLEALIEARPCALAKAELLERVWPSVFVSDASLARAVTELRDAVGDHARHARIVRTVHGYGYAFCADVRPITHPTASEHEPARCWLVSGPRSIALPEGEHLVGREPGASIWLDSPAVSRRHARLIVEAGHATIEDLRSKNGTFVCGDRISSRTALRPGDTIRVGRFTLAFRVAGGTTQTVTEEHTR